MAVTAKKATKKSQKTSDRVYAKNLPGKALIKAYKSGTSLATLAEQHNTGINTVRKAITLAGGSIRGRGRPAAG